MLHYARIRLSVSWRLLNLDGQNKFMHRALFDGEHHLLGLIIVPDERVPYYMELKPLTLLSVLVTRWKHRRQSDMINEVASARGAYIDTKRG